MLCIHCNNILQKITDGAKLRYQCTTCGSEYSSMPIDTLIHDDDIKHYSLTKDGRAIWGYPANPKVYKKCESKKCQQKIVSWENDAEMNRIYGCLCGYSWKEFVQST